jgi:hypothetical protein
MSTTLPQKDAKHVIERLRSGLVPERGLDAYAVGIERRRSEMDRMLEMAKNGEGVFKFLRGGYGCGKTFLARLTELDARKKDFATSFVGVSDNDLKFYKFEELYREIVSNLATETCPDGGALADIIDRFVGKIEAQLLDAQDLDPDSDEFTEEVRERIATRLRQKTDGNVHEEFVRAVQGIYEFKQAGDFGDASELLSWLSGSPHVSAYGGKKRAGIKQDLERNDALDFLRGILALVDAAGYKGLVLVVDELETILRSRSDDRRKSLDALMQILNDMSNFPGLLWVFTGTPEFFDSRRGVAKLEPLEQRIGLMDDGDFPDLRQPQMKLEPFDEERLEKVAHKIREIYPADHPDRVVRKIDGEFIAALVDEVTEGFKGDVGVIPRQFLRELIHHIGRADDYADFEPMEQLDFEPDPDDLRPEEREQLDEEAERGLEMTGEEW